MVPGGYIDLRVYSDLICEVVCQFFKVVKEVFVILFFLYRERCWSKGNNQNTTFQFVPIAIGMGKVTIQDQYFAHER